jgi:hypothetical protein
MRQVAFSVDKRGRARAYELRRSLGVSASGYFGRFFPISLERAREMVAMGQAEQISYQYQACPMEGAS